MFSRQNCKNVKLYSSTGREGLYYFGTLRIPHFLDNRLRNRGEVVILTFRPRSTPRNILGTHLCSVFLFTVCRILSECNFTDFAPKKYYAICKILFLTAQKNRQNSFLECPDHHRFACAQNGNMWTE
jgi:hypothetical protein